MREFVPTGNLFRAGKKFHIREFVPLRKCVHTSYFELRMTPCVVMYTYSVCTHHCYVIVIYDIVYICMH